MPIEIPTVAEITADIINKIESEFSITIPALPQISFFRSFAKVLAGVIWLLYKYGQRIMVNLLPSTADGDQLDNFGRLFKDLLRIKALNFIGTSIFTREAGTTGDIVIQEGHKLKNPAGATYYVLDEITLLDGNPTVIADIQSSDSGTIASMAIGGILTLDPSITNLQDTSIINTITQQASDEETHENYRTRLIERFSQRPQGGAKQDYIAWAKTVAGVTRVFPYDNGFSTAEIYFLRDDDGDENGDRIPDSTEITAVTNAIDASDKIPIGDFLRVLAPNERLFRITITTSAILNTSIKARLKNACINYFNSKVMFVDNNLSEVNCNQINMYLLMGILVQITSNIIGVQIDEVGGDIGIITLYLDRGDVGFLDSSVDITYTVV